MSDMLRPNHVTGAADAAPSPAPTGTARAKGSAWPPVKTRLRGWSHEIFTPIVLVAGLLLVALTPLLTERLADVVYTLSAVLLFGNSAFYHRGTWSERAHGIFRRVDHANIFVFIAGTYTPLAVGMLHGASLRLLLGIIWTCAAVGVLFRVFWITAPRWLYVALYIAMGWVAVWWLPQFWRLGGAAVVVLVALGGVVYTLGAVAYGTRRPNPWPGVFGFHEIFHACTVLAAVCHYIAICLVLFR